MGAKAVVAIGHSHDPYYIRALFTTRQTIRDYWTHAPGYNNHVLSFASMRTPGRTELLDPDYTTPSGFWRSLTGDMNLNTADVTGANYASTAGDPSSLVVPGNATPTADGTPFYGSVEDAVGGTNPTTTLTAATIVRVDAKETAVTTPGALPIYAVHTDGGPSGWMVGSTLKPRDSVAPRLWTVDAGTGAFSPNGDGVTDTMPISLRLSEVATWTATITDAGGNQLASSTGTSSTATITWAPAAGSVPDGAYHWTLTATDAYGNGPLAAHGDITVDTAAPSLTVAGDATNPRVFSPNGDAFEESVGYGVTSSEPGTALVSVRNAANAVVSSFGVPLSGVAATVTWNGTTTTGAAAPDGAYTVHLTVRDLAGNTSDGQDRPVIVDRTLGFVTTNHAMFFPQDGDALSPSVVFGFKLASPATVDWTIINSAGTVVRTIKTASPLAAGAFTFTWNGRNDAGVLVPRGTYRSRVVAVDPLSTRTQLVSVLADAFKVVVSDTTPGRGQRITVTATTAESLTTVPRLSVFQPRIAGYNVSMVTVSSGVYRATLTLKASSTGTVRFRVYAYDRYGHYQSTDVYLPLH